MPAGRSIRSTRGGTVFTLLVVLTVVFASLAMAWMLFLPSIVGQQLRQRTGFDVRIERLASNPFTGRMQLSGLLIENPREYGTRDFVRARRVHADAQLFTLFQKRAVFDHMLVDLEVVTLVTTVDGTTNLDLFRDRLEDGARANAPVTLAVALPLPLRAESYLVKRLEVTFDRLVLVNQAVPGTIPRELNLRYTHVYENISDTKQLMGPAFLGSVVAAGGAFDGLLSGAASQLLGEWARAGGGAVRDTANWAGDAVKSLFENLEETPNP